MVQQLAAAMLDLATEGEDEDDEGDQTVYCCACSVIDALARNAPARVMWPLVKDFTSSKVHAPLTEQPKIGPNPAPGRVCRHFRPSRSTCSSSLHSRRPIRIHETKC